MAAFTKACLGHGLVSLVLGNRIHVAPPLNVKDSEAATGLASWAALAEADKFLASSLAIATVHMIAADRRMDVVVAWATDP